MNKAGLQKMSAESSVDGPSTDNPLQRLGLSRSSSSSGSSTIDSSFSKLGIAAADEEFGKGTQVSAHKDAVPGAEELAIQVFTLEEVIESIPVGWFHMRMLMLCGLSFTADAMEVTLLAFMSTCAGVEWSLKDPEMAAITSAVFAGQFFGGLFWGPVADKYGRRNSFLATVLTITVAGIISAFSPNYTSLLIARMIVGFGVGGLTVPFDLLAEFLPAAQRGEYLMKMQYFWTLGSLFVSGCAWIMLTKDGWRALTLLASAPLVVATAVSVKYLPESPRWLMEQGRLEEAAENLREVMRINGMPVSSFVLAPLHDAAGIETRRRIRQQQQQQQQQTTEDSLVIQDGVVAGESPPASPVGTGAVSSTVAPTQYVQPDPPMNAYFSLYDLFTSQFKMYSHLLLPKNRGFSFSLWPAWLSFGFGYYGVILFVSRLYNTSSDIEALVCDFDYANVFINASAELVGIWLNIQVIDSMGRPWTMLASFLLAGMSALFMGVKTNAAGTLVVGCFARLFAVVANSTVWIITPELFRTEFRATGHAACNSWARIGAFLVPFVVQSDLKNWDVAIILLSVNMIGVLVSLVVPDTQGRDIDNPDFNVTSGERIDIDDYLIAGGKPRRFLRGTCLGYCFIPNLDDKLKPDAPDNTASAAATQEVESR